MAAAGRTGCCGFWLLRREGEEGPMMIDAKTKVLGLIGYPVGHSVSPVIHNSLAEIYGQNLVYVPLQAAPGKLEKAIEGAAAFNFPGMNVTVPYMSEVIPYLKEFDAPAKRIGAVNTLVRTEGGYKGYNTDMPGLYRAMCADGVRIEGEEVVLLGAGGVARAIAFLLLDKGARHVYIVNRSLERAVSLAQEVNRAAREQRADRKENGKAAAACGSGEMAEPAAACGCGKGTESATACGSGEETEFATAYPLDGYKKLDQSRRYIVIQATQVGMHPDTGHAVIEDGAFYRLVKAGYDVIFNPPDTRFMQLVRQAGGEAFHGLKMLLYQGIIAYELWNGISVSEEAAKEIYQKMEKALGV